jgi:hypothetical protein
MHRVDAESPGSTITKFHPAFAADGVDELLSCYITRPRPRRAPKVSSPRSILVHTTDTGDDWHIQIGLEDVVTSRRSSPAEPPVTCTCYYGTVGAMRTSALTAIEISLHCGGKVSRSVGGMQRQKAEPEFVLGGLQVKNFAYKNYRFGNN